MHNLCNISWFCGHDLWIDIVSAATVLLVAFFSFRCYKIDKKKKSLALAFSFLLIAIAFVFNILTNFSVYTHVFETRNFGTITIIQHSYMLSPILKTIGYLAYRFFMLLGLYNLFSLKSENPKTTHVLIVLLIFIAVFFSRSSYYVFNILALLLLLFIAHQYYSAYIEKKNKNTLCLFWAFSIIAASQVIFTFVMLNFFYAVASIVQLIGYLILLLALARIVYYAKKKNKN